MKTYLCPLCQKKSAYVNEYGLPDSVICKCQGLKEVGRVSQGVYTPHPQLSSSQNTKAIGTNSLFAFGDYAFVKLTKDEEIKQMGIKFQNALENTGARQRFMSLGEIWVALNQKDENLSVMFMISHDKVLKNVVLKRNATPSGSERETIKKALTQKGLINN